MNYGIQQAKILKPKVIIPFGSNLFHLDDPKSAMNKGVATPIDFVNYAKKNQLGIWSGDFLEPSKWRKENRK